MESFNILLLGDNTSWCKHVIEKHILSNQTGFLSSQNLSLAEQMTCLLIKTICRLARYPIKAENPRIVHEREYSPGDSAIYPPDTCDHGSTDKH